MPLIGLFVEFLLKTFLTGIGGPDQEGGAAEAEGAALLHQATSGCRSLNKAMAAGQEHQLKLNEG